MDFTELWPDGPKYANDGRAFPLTADSVLLADFAQAEDLRRVLDVGCGSGIIGLLIAWNNREAHVIGVDISEDAVMCARDNIAQNALDDRVDVMCGDILGVALPEGSFDLVVCNPPYFEKGRGKSGGTAREESTATLRDITERASKLLCAGGAFCIVTRPERLSETLETMTEIDFSPARLRLVAHTANSAPSMVLIDARLGVTTELEVLSRLVLTDEKGGDSEEIKRIYRMD